ncbi:hypothetical protein E2C01_015783 [Portunus trituberculatus]|uniref:Uncharacterized protein n=1 Tax=Portunus trituberculatus TaxID=210409 RepID=A0A5B7DNW4_PORTR|nr:hypothetical protein [Portunus trituberculatus]
MVRGQALTLAHLQRAACAVHGSNSPVPRERASVASKRGGQHHHHHHHHFHTAAASTPSPPLYSPPSLPLSLFLPSVCLNPSHPPLPISCVLRGDEESGRDMMAS